MLYIFNDFHNYHIGFISLLSIFEDADIIWNLRKAMFFRRTCRRCNFFEHSNELNAFQLLLISDQNPEECDATGDDSSNAVGFIIILLIIVSIMQILVLHYQPSHHFSLHICQPISSSQMFIR